MRKLSGVAAGGLLAAIWSSVQAQTPATESVIVTGTRLVGTVTESDPNVTVIDAAQIAARHPSSMTELLRSLPGVFVQQAGARGSVVSLFIRGAKPNFVLVLIDGVKVNDPTNTRGGSFDFSTLSLDVIERIELVRGPASAIYGADAVGGVINFITREPSPGRQADFDGSVGGYGFYSAEGHVGDSLGNAAFRLGASYVDNGMPVPGSTLRNTTLDGAISENPFEDLSLGLTARYSMSRARSFPDSSGGPLLALIRQTDRRDIDEGIVGGHASYAVLGAWTVALDYGLYERAYNSISPGVAPSPQTPTGIPPNDDDVHFLRNEMTATARYLSQSSIEAAFGVDLQRERGVDDGMLDFGGRKIPTRFALDRTTWAGFGQLRDTVFESLQLAIGARFDESGGTENFSPQASATYEVPTWGTRLSVSWGTGFRMPSFYALGNPVVGNPSLRPEHATNLEAGVTQSLTGSQSSLKFDWYDTQYTNLIDFMPGAVPKLVNLSNVRVEGAEASADLELSQALTLTPSLSYTVARNGETGAQLRDVPHWLASGVLTWSPSSSVTFSATLLQVGAFIDNAVPTGDVRLSGHMRLDASATWHISPRLSLYVAAENLLDAQYQDAIGFPASGLVMRVGLRSLLY